MLIRLGDLKIDGKVLSQINNNRLDDAIFKINCPNEGPKIWDPINMGQYVECGITITDDDFYNR